MPMALGIGIGVPYGGQVITGAAQLLEGETDGVAFDFTDMSAAVYDTSTPANNFIGNPNDLLTYSSPSTKYIRNSAGIYVPGTTLRTEYDASGNPLGILVEEARTNNAVYNTVMDNATGGYVETRISVTPNAATSPTGDANASKFIPNTDNASHKIFSPTFSNGSTQSWVNSVLAKIDEYDTVGVAISDSTESNYQLFRFDLTNETATFDASGGTLVTSPSGDLEAVGNGWYLCWITATVDSSAGSLRFVVWFGNGDSLSLAGDGTSGLYASLGQAEIGTFPTSPIITAGSTVTRNADNITLALSATPLPDMTGSADVISVYSKAILASAGARSGFPNIWDVANATDTDRIFQYMGSGANTTLRMGTTDGGGAEYSETSSTYSDDAEVIMAVRCKEDDYASSYNGGTQDTNSDVDVFGAAATVIQIGADPTGANHANTHIKQLAFVPRAWDNTTLESKVGN